MPYSSSLNRLKHNGQTQLHKHITGFGYWNIPGSPKVLAGEHGIQIENVSFASEVTSSVDVQLIPFYEEQTGQLDTKARNQMMRIYNQEVELIMREQPRGRTSKYSQIIEQFKSFGPKFTLLRSTGK